MYPKHRPESDFEVAQCPVCRAILGQRDRSEIFSAHCVECRATFYFKPWAHTPSAVLDSAKKFKGYCGPDGCKCRD